MEATLHRDLYQQAEWFAKEREGIFFRDWTCVGRESELAANGDFKLVDLLGESILLVRGEDGIARAFFNVCRHRGCQLIDSADPDSTSGRFNANIRCPYHSWTYRLDGALHLAPHMNVEKDKLHLYRLPLDSWGGFLFVNVSGSEATLISQLGEIPQRTARYPLADLECGIRIDYSVDANWKVILENYNECYHCAGVHPELCKIVPAFRQKGGAGLDWEAGIPQREGTNTFTFDGTTNRKPFPGLNEIEKERHFGELIYPNLMLSLSMDHAAVFILWPEAAERTNIECLLLFHPDEMQRDDFDPTDAAEFWDVVNQQDWHICERVQRGMHARPFKHGYYAPMEDLSLDIRNYVSERIDLD